MVQTFFVVRTCEQTNNDLYRYLHECDTRFGHRLALTETDNISCMTLYETLEEANRCLMVYLQGQKTLSIEDFIIEKLVLTIYDVYQPSGHLEIWYETIRDILYSMGLGSANAYSERVMHIFNTLSAEKQRSVLDDCLRQIFKNSENYSYEYETLKDRVALSKLSYSTHKNRRPIVF